MFHDHHADYHAARAEAEAIRAIRADDPVVAAVHQDLCLRYSGRVIAALILAGVDRIRRE
ncbi:hypothetical protein [Sphingomonas sp.]|jgi:hypothetical protein|uniref:hypothetical protein n=1 Tax=Sphingomonas sp. TaxID=28214 RepID=UPI0035C804E1